VQPKSQHEKNGKNDFNNSSMAKILIRTIQMNLRIFFLQVLLGLGTKFILIFFIKILAIEVLLQLFLGHHL